MREKREAHEPTDRSRDVDERTHVRPEPGARQQNRSELVEERARVPQREPKREKADGSVAGKDGALLKELAREEPVHESSEQEDEELGVKSEVSQHGCGTGRASQLPYCTRLEGCSDNHASGGLGKASADG